MTRAKWTGDVVQAVESLLCKSEVLSSNSSPTKKKKKKENSPFLLAPYLSEPHYLASR
jgi:hypothetical protein